jgi:hypothetical protein
MAYRWIVYGRSGEELRETEGFSSREEAEEWMRNQWAALVDEGGARVTLTGDDGAVFDMGLEEG